MSNLEHLIENGLSVLKRGVSYEKWLKTMKDDVNWQGNENISIEQLWTICQYVIYTWTPSAEPDRTVIDKCLFKINSNISPHTSTPAVIEIKYYIQELYEEIYGKGAKPKWMI